jgi:hypothetical protein
VARASCDLTTEQLFNSQDLNARDLVFKAWLLVKPSLGNFLQHGLAAALFH